MGNDNYIKVPEEFARVLERMGLPEYKIIQEDINGFIITAPIELCRVLTRMGNNFKYVSNLDYIFRKATECADVSIAETVLSNQNNITNVSQTGDNCIINVKLNKILELTSSETGLTKKYICMLIGTNYDTIEGLLWDGEELTSKDVQDSIDMGGTASDICWWIPAEDIIETELRRTVGTAQDLKTISISANDVSRYNLNYTNVDGNISAIFIGDGDRIIYPGEEVISKGESVTATFSASNSKFIDTISINNGSPIGVGMSIYAMEISANTNEDIAVEVTEIGGSTISYNSNNVEATGVTPNTVSATGYNAIVADNGYYLDGMSFIGWNTASDGTGTTYYPGSQILLNSDIELFAIWENAQRACTVTITVTNPDFDSELTVNIQPESGVIGGAGDYNFAFFDVIEGEYTYTCSANGYNDLSGTFTITNEDIGGHKSIDVILTKVEV